jgi:hypothetical protein
MYSGHQHPLDEHKWLASADITTKPVGQWQELSLASRNMTLAQSGLDAPLEPNV